MGSIYQFSKITIAAAKSGDGNGCFVDGPKSVMFSPGSPNHHGAKVPLTVFARILPIHEDFHFDNYYHLTHEKHKMPLFSRAWTFQEELLAPRVLYFGPTEVTFQCKTTLDCQCGLIASELSSKSSSTTKMQYEKGFRNTTSESQIRPQWARVVQQYSGRHLTKETDRLPALSGLAKEFQQQGFGSYNAGLWTKDFPLWLTWSCRGNTLRTGSYIGPSWSWASIPCGTAILHRILESYSEPVNIQNKLRMLETKCELAGSDPTGAVKSGHLLVVGPVVEATLRYRDSTDGIDPPSWPNGSQSWVQRGQWEAYFCCDYCDEEFQTTMEGRSVYCLVCTVGAKAYYLVLIPTTKTGEYKRIGIGYTKIVKADENWGGTTIRERLVYNIRMPFSKSRGRRPVMEAWFRNAEEREMRLV